MLDDVWGWEGKPPGCVVVYRNSDAFPPAQDATEVAVDTAKVADLFVATPDPRDWTAKTRADATPMGS
jgi:hypothetical protein